MNRPSTSTDNVVKLTIPEKATRTTASALNRGDDSQGCRLRRATDEAKGQATDRVIES